MDIKGIHIEGGIISSATLVQLLNYIKPRTLGEHDSSFHIGEEQAKAKVRTILATSLGSELIENGCTKLLKELRHGRS